MVQDYQFLKNYFFILLENEEILNRAFHIESGKNVPKARNGFKIGFGLI